MTSQSTAKAKPKLASKKKGPAPQVPAWERMEICCWLALTDNIREVSRMTKRARLTISNIQKEEQDQILRLRAEMSVELKSDFDATIRRIHLKAREMVDWITEENATRLSSALFDLCKSAAIETERRQILSDLPSEISRVEGDEPDPEADKKYLRKLMDEIAQERNAP